MFNLGTSFSSTIFCRIKAHSKMFSEYNFTLMDSFAAAKNFTVKKLKQMFTKEKKNQEKKL
jgi:hypothetical protein